MSSSSSSSSSCSCSSAEFGDHYSVAVSKYRSYRPSYPPDLFAYISSLCSCHDLCVDAGCGNGQATQSICKYFKKVIAFDPSNTMVDNAIKDAANIEYLVSRGEDFADYLHLPSGCVDLVISATAVHWMNLPQFYANAHRVLKAGGLLIVFAYDFFEISSNEAVSKILRHFAYQTLCDFWPKEIAYTVGKYHHLPFPAIYTQEFNEKFHVSFPLDVNDKFLIERSIHYENFMGLLQSWSGTQYWFKAKGQHAKQEFLRIAEEIKAAWSKKKGTDELDTEKEVHHLYMKLGRKPDANLEENAPLELRPAYTPLENDAFQKIAAKILESTNTNTGH